ESREARSPRPGKEVAHEALRLRARRGARRVVARSRALACASRGSGPELRVRSADLAHAPRLPDDGLLGRGGLAGARNQLLLGRRPGVAVVALLGALRPRVTALRSVVRDL